MRVSILRIPDGMKVRLRSERTQSWVAEECLVASGFRSRLTGLLGRSLLREGEGLLLQPCAQIHMWFMRIPIDVVFLKRVGQEARQWRVTSVQEGVLPWRLLPLGDRSAQDTLELPVGAIRRCDLKMGDILCIN